MDDGVDDVLEEMREMLGVDLNSSCEQQSHIQVAVIPDTETQRESQRLLQHLLDPVETGSNFTTLQVGLARVHLPIR